MSGTQPLKYAFQVPTWKEDVEVGVAPSWVFRCAAKSKSATAKAALLPSVHIGSCWMRSDRCGATSPFWSAGGKWKPSRLNI